MPPNNIILPIATIKMSNTGGMTTPTAAKRIQEHDDWVTLTLIKMLYTTFYMAEGVLHPFLPEYYASLGYGGQIIGLLGSITPFTTFLVGPFWGVLSDTLDAPFTILYVTISITLLGQLLVGVVNDPYVVMALVCIKSFFGAPDRSIIDSLVLQQMNDRSQFGKMRLWGLVGSGLGTGIAGYFLEGGIVQSDESAIPTTVIDLLSGFYKSLSGYRLLFFVHILLHIPVFIVLRFFQVDRRNSDIRKVNVQIEPPKVPQLTSLEVLLSVARNHDAVVFFVVVYAMGIAGGIADNFTYARFREVGGSGANMGASRVFSSVSGAVMFWYSGPLNSLLGSDAVTLLSLLTVSLRFWFYAVMDTPVYGYIGETIRGFTFGCFWSTATVYASDIAPDGARATMLLLLNGSYNGIGRSTGAIIGGKLQASIGTAKIFHHGAAAFLLMAFLFGVYVSKFSSRRKREEATKEKIQ